MSVSEGLMCNTLYGHAFQTYHVRPMAVFGESNTKATTLQYPVGVTKLPVERDFLVLRVYS